MLKPIPKKPGHFLSTISVPKEYVEGKPSDTSRNFFGVIRIGEFREESTFDTVIVVGGKKLSRWIGYSLWIGSVIGGWLVSVADCISTFGYRLQGYAEEFVKEEKER